MYELCGFRPFPGNGAYGHWTCERPRHHLGRHRFRNYTIGRVPRLWRLGRLRRSFKADRRVRRLAPEKSGQGYRRALYPTRYEPVDA